MKPSPERTTAVELLIADLERAAKVLPTASPTESEAVLVELAARIDALGGPTPVPAEHARRARSALSALSATITVLRASTDARIRALLQASRPSLGYNGAGRFDASFDASVHGTA